MTSVVPGVEFTVYGVAKPAGSKKAFVNRKTGRAQIKDDSDNRTWRQEVALTAIAAMGGDRPLTGPLAVEFVFYRPRPAGHYGSGRNQGTLKEAAPMYPVIRPDVLKLARLVEDALTGIVYQDDAQIVLEVLAKVYGAPERLDVTVTSHRGD